MVSSVLVAVVSDQLKAADHLAHGEETNAFGGYDATGNELGSADVLHSLQDGSW